MTSAPAIGFEYRPSQLIGRILSCMAALAAMAILLCGWPWWLKAALWLALGIAFVRAWRRWRHPGIQAAGWRADGSWSLHRAGADDAVAQMEGFRVLGACIVLRLRMVGQRRVALLLAPDNSDADLRRRLRMRLAAGIPPEA
jgi:toxin CptA